MLNGNHRLDMVFRLCAVLCACLTVCTTSLAGQDSSSPKAVLLRYMEKGRTVEYTAIRTQMSGCDDLGALQLKVENNVAGQQCMTILAPMAIQGQVFLDDGSKYLQYLPDENRLYETKSPSAYFPNARDRMTIAEKNYTFSFGKGPKIAGRKVIYIVATPKDADMPTRRYGIDEKTSVMLRIESIINNTTTVFIDTRAIEFKQNGALGDLSIKPAAGVRRIKMQEPIRVTSNSAALSMTGMTPIIPPSLPGGFVARDPEIIKANSEQFLAIRLTDGLVMATIYQLNAKGASGSAQLTQVSLERVYGNVRFAVGGDIPESVMRRLLTTFVAEASKNSGPTGRTTRNSVGSGSRLTVSGSSSSTASGGKLSPAGTTAKVGG